MKTIRRGLQFMIAATASLLVSLTVYAAGSGKVMQVISDDEIVKVYLQGGGGEASAYQIGNIPAEIPVSYAISEDDMPMRTLIMLDNSLSIPQGSRKIITDRMKQIIRSHGENERFRLATFSENISYLAELYSADYTALQNMIDGIGFFNQETYLTDVLYDVIEEVENEGYDGYTRIIVISDGVDNKPIGITREELNKKLDEASYPVYGIGVKTASNSQQLENMFAISRRSGCD